MMTANVTSRIPFVGSIMRRKQKRRRSANNNMSLSVDWLSVEDVPVPIAVRKSLIELVSDCGFPQPSSAGAISQEVTGNKFGLLCRKAWWCLFLSPQRSQERRCDSVSRSWKADPTTTSKKYPLSVEVDHESKQTNDLHVCFLWIFAIRTDQCNNSTPKAKYYNPHPRAVY